jgi:Flp pilus assembly protein TadG
MIRFSRTYFGATCMPRSLSCRRGAVSVIFAISTIPILGFCGLAVDYGVWSEVNANLTTAVNVAALNAVKIAANGYINHDPNYVAEAQTAGTAWFYAIEQSMRPQTTPGTINISITGNASITATATYSGASMSRIVGKIFGTTPYFFNVQAAATINTATYLEVVMMLDNSSSMDIAASVQGINQLMTLSACDPSNAYYDNLKAPFLPPAQWNDPTQENYGNYQYLTSGGIAFDGTTAAGITLDPPVNGQVPVGPYPAYVPNEYPTGVLTNVQNKTTFQEEFWNPVTSATSSATGQTCQGVLPAQASGAYPLPGAPCAFACHWTNETKWLNTNIPNADPRGGTADLWGLARRNGIQLRFDVVKNATNYILGQMAQNTNAGVSNLSVGVYTFNSGVQQVYPSGCTPQTTGCEAGTDFTAAEAAVGLPPTPPAVKDTGIQPILAGKGLNGQNNDDTAFPEDMNALASTYITAAGDGTTAATPRKVLILVTDGFQDDPNLAGTAGERQAFNSTYCQQFKNLGYQIYVVFTPYYPVPHFDYLISNWAPIVQGTGPTSITANLQACSSQSSDPNGTYYIAASDEKDIKSALLTFLQQALKSPARYTQ